MKGNGMSPHPRKAEKGSCVNPSPYGDRGVNVSTSMSGHEAHASQLGTGGGVRVGAEDLEDSHEVLGREKREDGEPVSSGGVHLISALGKPVVLNWFLLIYPPLSHF